MNEHLREYLRENETVCWESKVKPFRVLDGSYMKKFLVKCLISLGIAGGIIGGHLASGSNPKEGLIALVVFAVVAVALLPFMERARLMKATYWITDQRVIMLGSDKLMRSMEVMDIDAYKIAADQSADSCLVLGSSVFKDADKNMRWRAGNPKMPEDAGSRKDHALGMILYNVEKADEALALLKTLGCARAA